MLKGYVLKDFQQRILDELADYPAIGLFIKTGGGKTITSLERTLRYNPTKNLLVICPQKIVTQWFEKIEETTDFNVCRYKMTKLVKEKNAIMNEFNKSVETNKAFVINFEVIQNVDLDFIDDTYTIILDESHKIKNYFKVDRKGNIKSGYNTAKILELGERTAYKIILTATPAEKKLGGYIDYFAQLKFLGYLDMNERLFKNRYCIEAKTMLPGMPFPRTEIIGYRMPLIESEIKSILRATCRYYAPQYGEYEPHHIIVEIDKAKNYAKFVNNRAYEEITCDNVTAFRVAKKTLTGGIITGTDEYKERHNYKDNTNKADWLEEFLGNTDDVVSVIYNYNVERDLIIELCNKIGKKFQIIDGSVKDKPAALKKDFEVLIGQYKAVGESLDGLHLKSHLMVFYSMPDSSEQYTQTCGRIDRIGQTEMPVYYHLIMSGTIDKAVQDMIDEKKEFTEADLDELTVDV